MATYIKLTIKVNDPALNDQLIAMLSLMKFDGFEETAGELMAFIDESAFNKVEVEDICTMLNVKYFTSVVPEQNWNALWESNFEPVVVDDFCTIRADFHQEEVNTPYEIVITPKMSFGTGHHATTYLVIQQMRELNFAGKIVADFGTGTGVLAIMAEKLGAKDVLGIDHDDWSIENAQENIVRNNCRHISLMKLDQFRVNRKFDIILANINKNVIVDNLNNLVNGLNNGGLLLVSGLLKTDETDVVSAFQQKGLTRKTTVTRENWIAILFSL